MYRRRTDTVLRLLCLALLCLTLPGCTQGPSKVAWDFHRALFMRDCEKAFKLLSLQTRTELERRAQAASEASGGALPDKASTMICQGDLAFYQSSDLSGRDVVEVERVMVPEDATRAIVNITLSGQRYPMTLVREAEGWRIELDLEKGEVSEATPPVD